MIRKLDRYLFVSFLLPFLLCLVLILAMVMVVETSERLSKLLKYSGPDPFVGLLGQYYLCRVPALATMIAPVITLSGAIVALVRLARQNELMAIQAVGVSLRRIAAPLLAAGILAAAAAAYVQEVVVPGGARTMQRVSIKLFGGGEDPMIFKNVFAVDPKTSVWLRAGELDTRKKIMRHAEAGFPLEGLSTSPMQITEGRWRDKNDPDADPADPEDGRWYVTGWQDVENEEGLSKKRFADRILKATLTPEDLAEGAVSLSMRTLKELRDFSRQFPTRASQLDTEVHKRLAYPFANIVLLVLAIPLVVGPGGRASMRGIGFAVLVSLGFYVVMLGMLDFGYRGYVPAYVAAWTPISLFAVIGGWMFSRAHG